MNNMKGSNIHITGLSGGEERENGEENIWGNHD